MTACLVGGAATSMEEKSDEEVQEAALQVLRNIYGEAVQQPVACAVTRWAQDPFSKGRPHLQMSRAVLCQAVPCCAEPCRVVLCFAVLCSVW